MNKVILITGASSGFGEMTAYALADAGYTVFASMRDTAVRNAPKVAKALDYAKKSRVDLRTIELDVTNQNSVDLAVAEIIGQAGGIDVLVHNAGHMVLGPSEAFTPAQFAQQYDVNVLGAQRVNRAALPHMRRARSGLLIWVSSTSVRGGTPPYLGPYFAAKAAMESLAISYAGELSLWGIETTILAPGVFTRGTNHFLNSGHPQDSVVVAEYASGPTRDLVALVEQGHERVQPDSSDPHDVARAIVDIVKMPSGRRPLHVTVDPADMGYEVMAMMGDRIRGDVFRRMGLQDLLTPRRPARGTSVQVTQEEA